MSTRTVTIKTSTLQQAIKDFKDLWQRHARREEFPVPVETLRFEDSSALLKTLTPGRLALLQCLRVLGKTSIRALAKAVDREYSNTHQDVKILGQAGLILQDKSGKCYVPRDKIVVEIPLLPPELQVVQSHEVFDSVADGGKPNRPFPVHHAIR